jgi:uncharacterized membrane protein (UPF0127 family)
VTHRQLAARNTSRGTTLAFPLEDAASFWARVIGLMGRASLAPGEGLWLPGENAIHMLFMRFAIDVVFVAKPATEGGPRRVVALRRALPAWRGVVWHASGASGVIELPVGAIDASGTAVGDEIEILAN